GDSLTATATTAAGLRVRRQVDNNEYPAGVRVSDAELNTVRLGRSEFHGDWNYAILAQEQL
ncbi:MAG TPA: ISAzo13 family transposase, partial [Desulfotomaculum sp.]|nr:ISAzo13 family transposase [Desulfotomaculum sp.]